MKVLMLCACSGAIVGPRSPVRTAATTGYVARPELVTWAPFRYATPGQRRATVREYVHSKLQHLPILPPLHVLLIGGVATGKGTIAPMISQAFRVRSLSVGDLVRGEARAGRARGVDALSTMAQGELLADELVLQLLRERLGGDADIARNGWLLDGFPRSVAQAEALLRDEWAALIPDAVVVVERPDELAREFALGRCCDSATGQTYHPIYAPPPAEIQDRLVWRVDDTQASLERRLDSHRRSVGAIIHTFQVAGVPLRRFENARSELATFGDVAAFLSGVAMDKLARARDQRVRELRTRDVAAGPRTAPNPYVELSALGGPGFQTGTLPSPTSVLAEASEALQPAETESPDVPEICDLEEEDSRCLERYRSELGEQISPDLDGYCDVDEGESACVQRYQASTEVGALLAAVRRCHVHEPREFVPLLVGDAQIGWLNSRALEALSSQLAVGHACERVSAEQLRDGEATLAAARTAGGFAVRIAPGSGSVESRTSLVAVLVEELLADGFIPRAKLRDELQDVHAMSAAVDVHGEGVPPLLRMERAAMIYFGIPSCGVHINGWVRDPQHPESSRPCAMWVAKRSLSKATYAGLLDQMVAGGQPTGVSIAENVRKESEEEASLPPEVVAQITPTGPVSYRYATPKGLSTKTLMTFDVEMPADLQPLCADGEVDEFRLMPIDEVLRSLRDDLPLWKPNSALVAIAFCMRHGLVDETEPGYAELVQLLLSPSPVGKC